MSLALAHRKTYASNRGRLASAVVGLALSSLACRPALASEEVEPPRDRACFDEAYENTHPECTDAERRELHSRFNLPSIKRYSRLRQAQGDVIVAYYWTKIGGGTAFALHRDQTGRALLELRLVPIGSRHRRVSVHQIKITREIWLEIVTKAHSLDFSYRPGQVCVGGARIMLEAMSGPGRVRTRRHDLCYRDDEVRLYFHDLAEIALTALPRCARFGRNHENESDADAMLHRCLVSPDSRGRRGPEGSSQDMNEN